MPYYKSGGHNMPWLRKDWGFLCGSRDMVRGRVAQAPLTELFQTQGRQLGLELNKTTAHVGLEASVFHQMAPGNAPCTVGMEVLDPHSVHERVKLDTIEPFGRLLAAVIREYGK